MPMYDFYCTECGEEQEHLVMSHWEDPICDCTGRLLRADVVPVVASYIGYSATGTDYGVRGGTVFHSAKQRAAYDKKFKISGIHDKNSGQGKIMHEEARWQADVAASDQGYKNHETYRAKKKVEKRMEKGQLASFEKKIQV